MKSCRRAYSCIFATAPGLTLKLCIKSVTKTNSVNHQINAPINQLITVHFFLLTVVPVLFALGHVVLWLAGGEHQTLKHFLMFYKRFAYQSLLPTLAAKLSVKKDFLSHSICSVPVHLVGDKTCARGTLVVDMSSRIPEIPDGSSVV